MSSEAPKRTTLSPELRAKMERRGAIERIAAVLAEDAPLETAEDFEMAATAIVDRGLSDLRKALTASPPAGTVGVDKAMEQALRNIAEGNLGDAPWQANYDKIREVAAAALRALTVGTEPKMEAELHEFTADPNRPGQCYACGRNYDARIHDVAADTPAVGTEPKTEESAQ